jgi:pilus assembly protein CpaE
MCSVYPFQVVVVGGGEDILPDVRRELCNRFATLEAEFPDVAGAVARLPLDPADKRLFIIRLASPQDLPQLRRLSSTYPGQPVVALMDGATDNRALIQAMRAGAAQVVLVPLRPDDFQGALESVALQFGHPAGESRVVAVSGVTEGSGATTVAINLAYQIAHIRQARCILAELSLRMGRLGTYLDIDPRFTTQDLLADADRLDLHMVEQALTPFGEHPHVLAGPRERLQPLAPPAPAVLRLVEYSRRLAGVVVLDMPYTFDELYFQALAAADQVVLVGEQAVPSLHDLELVRETLRLDYGIRATYPVINRYDPRKPNLQVSRLAEVLHAPHLLTIANDNAAVSAALDNGRPLQLQAPNSPALRDIDALARLPLGVANPAAGGRLSGLLHRLTHPFSANGH